VGLAVVQGNKNPFKGRQFTAEIILWAVLWYLQFPISYRDLKRMFSDRGIQVDHTTLFRWIQAYAPELEKRIRPHLRMTNGSWRVDETYVRVKGKWLYLYRAVDATGQTVDFLLSPKRDAAAAKRFFRKALRQPHTVNPRTITVAKNAAYPIATKAMKQGGGDRQLNRRVTWIGLFVRHAPDPCPSLYPPPLSSRSDQLRRLAVLPVSTQPGPKAVLQRRVWEVLLDEGSTGTQLKGPLENAALR
jgi:transposase-like protein